MDVVKAYVHLRSSTAETAIGVMCADHEPCHSANSGNVYPVLPNLHTGAVLVHYPRLGVSEGHSRGPTVTCVYCLCLHQDTVFACLQVNSNH